MIGKREWKGKGKGKVYNGKRKVKEREGKS